MLIQASPDAHATGNQTVAFTLLKVEPYQFLKDTSKNCLIANEQKLKVLLCRGYSQ
jgi:hypothetical protein